MPFICNFVSLVLCFGCELASECCKSIGEMKEKEAKGDMSAFSP